MLTVLDLFSGIGGISLGLESTGGFRTVAFCEIDPFCREVLHAHWPKVTIHEDVRGLSIDVLGGVRPDAIVGGFPCQPFSVAGRKQAQNDTRHLWPHFARLIRDLRPRWVIAENVPGIRTLAADEVCADLEAAGYTCWPLVVGADDVGAPHRRKRVWFVARRLENAHEGGSRAENRDAGDEGRRTQAWGETVPQRGATPISDAGTSGRNRWPARPGEPQHEWEEPRLVGNTTEARRRAQPEECDQRGPEGVALSSAGRECAGTRLPEQPLGSPVDGLPLDLVRLARRGNREALKAAGNSVVPQVVATIGRAILEAERLG